MVYILWLLGASGEVEKKSNTHMRLSNIPLYMHLHYCLLTSCTYHTLLLAPFLPTYLSASTSLGELSEEAVERKRGRLEETAYASLQETRFVDE